MSPTVSTRKRYSPHLSRAFVALCPGAEPEIRHCVQRISPLKPCTCARSGRRILQMCMGDSANSGESPVERSMGGKIRGRAQGSFDDLALHICEDQMPGLHLMVDTPLGLITINPSSRAIAPAFPKLRKPSPCGPTPDLPQGLLHVVLPFASILDPSRLSRTARPSTLDASLRPDLPASFGDRPRSILFPSQETQHCR